MKIWKLKKGHDARLRSRHPWVFSNELLDSPKSIKAGEPVEIQDYQGHFMARGYGNPYSLIAFRAMSFQSAELAPVSVESVVEKLLKAWQYRDRCGFRQSFRLCYSEVDQIPGLILDRYVIRKNNKNYQVFSYQLLTAGLDVLFKNNRQWCTILQSLVDKSVQNQLSSIDWDHTFVLQKNDVNIRKLEGLEVEEPLVLKTLDGDDLRDVEIVVQNVIDTEDLVYFKVNLPEGQKTGFFLDQTFNMRLLVQQLEYQKDHLKNKTVRILDLCCYMGQWSTQIVHNLKQWGIQAEVHLVDVSELALKMAQKNLERYTTGSNPIQIFAYKKDVLDVAELFDSKEGKSSQQFDVVISDPPAFVKNKKDIHQGLHAYLKLNSQAFKLAAPGAVVVSCTCSGLVQMEDFKEALRKAILRSGKNVRCVAFGAQGWDHPTLMNFPEGYYLKMVMHQLD